MFWHILFLFARRSICIMFLMTSNLMHGQELVFCLWPSPATKHGRRVEGEKVDPPLCTMRSDTNFIWGGESIVPRYHGCITTLLRIVNTAKQKWDPSFNKISKCFEISSPQLNRKPFICQRDARVVARAATTCSQDLSPTQDAIATTGNCYMFSRESLYTFIICHWHPDPGWRVDPRQVKMRKHLIMSCLSIAFQFWVWYDLKTPFFFNHVRRTEI